MKDDRAASGGAGKVHPQKTIVLAAPRTEMTNKTERRLTLPYSTELKHKLDVQEPEEAYTEAVVIKDSVFISGAAPNRSRFKVLSPDVRRGPLPHPRHGGRGRLEGGERMKG